jgi:amino acid transporter
LEGTTVDIFGRAKRLLIGAPRDIHDPRLFHKVSLVAFLAWVGLGADGLTSSAYGPDEAFRALRGHTELAIFLAAATALTVAVISYAYSRTIEQFPAGGGYAVATKLLGPTLGAVSGCALLVDYVLTVTVSIVSGADQVFSMLPLETHYLKVPLVIAALAVLVLMNLRGVKESVTIIAPIFVVFLLSHAILLVGMAVTHAGSAPAVTRQVVEGLNTGVSAIGVVGMLMVLARAYAQGAGTYTGIEAVSNAVQIMREPKVATAQRTMVYMAASLAILAGGILVGYMLLGVGVEGEPGKTLNAVLCEKLGFGQWFVVITLLSEAALLCVAAQTGFIGGPRVMANMAADSWIPHRFSSLSERMSLQDGVLLMGIAAFATLLYTGGDIKALVTMYAINVFITFSLTQVGMCRHWLRRPRETPRRIRRLIVHGVGFLMCFGILAIVVYEKFYIPERPFEGAWVTLAVTGVLVVLCFLIRYYYRKVRETFARFAQQVEALPAEPALPPARDTPDPDAPTASLLVSGYTGLGIHSFLTILRLFPKTYRQIVFVSVGVMDSGSFKGVEEVDRLHKETEENLQKYVALARRLGLTASAVMRVGTDPVAEAEELCTEIAQKYPKTTFFAGQLIFERETWYHRLLHNETAFAIQRRLQWRGLPLLILPARVMTT